MPEVAWPTELLAPRASGGNSQSAAGRTTSNSLSCSVQATDIALPATPDRAFSRGTQSSVNPPPSPSSERMMASTFPQVAPSDEGTFSRAPYQRSRTKIVATVGPACSAPEMLAELIQAGVDVFRLNMAHGKLESHAEVVANIRRISAEVGHPIGILVDLGGPKLRLGQLPGDEVELRSGEEFRFVRGDFSQDPKQLVSSYGRLVDELAVGNRVMLADGTVSLVVEERGNGFVRCRVLQPGVVRSRQGINLPGARLSLPALTDADRAHAAWAAKTGIDFVSLSFVRSPDDVRDLKTILRNLGSKARVIAKIEKPEALEQLDAIVTISDGIMIARGDLGVEIDVARVPVVQKAIIETCLRHQKPVIVATQMLDSMQHNRRPTRAEATDVANAILDGCDACMLSGETAIGEYPRIVVEMMQRIAQETETLFLNRPSLPRPATSVEGLHPITQTIVYGAEVMAQQLGARLVVCASHSGATALAMSKRRSYVPTIGVSDSEETLRQMCLYWGVVPLSGADLGNSFKLLDFVKEWGCRDGCLASTDRMVLVTGTGALSSGAHNMLVVHQVP